MELQLQKRRNTRWERRRVVCTNGTDKMKTIIGKDVETKRLGFEMKWNQKPQAREDKVKARRREKLIELEGIGEARTCPSYALNYVAFKMLCFRFEWDFLSRFGSVSAFGYLYWRFIGSTAMAIHQTNCTSSVSVFSSLVSRSNWIYGSDSCTKAIFDRRASLNEAEWLSNHFRDSLISGTI